ncbi:hypothetical protein [Actinophytocola sp.]|uniref:hypothetical protein n=1 Tax=Actinophytocola sp. TaxID=1872138 RepID=UPI003D6B8BBB
MELINTMGTRVRVRDEHAERLLAAGYTRPNPDQPATPTRRATTRSGKTTARHRITSGTGGGSGRVS